MWRTRRERDGRRRGDGRRSGGARPRALLTLALTALLAACGGPTNEGDLTPQATLMAEPGSVRVALDGRCSLGEAILAAERDASVNECLHDGVPGPDTITLRPGGVYLADTVYDAPELPTFRDTALPPVASEITVLGNDAELVRPEGALLGPVTRPGGGELGPGVVGEVGHGFLRVLPSGHLTVRDLTFRRGVGYAPLVSRGRMELLGVKILDSGRNSAGLKITNYAAFAGNSVLLEDCVISGARNIGSTASGIAGFGNLTMRDCVIEDNRVMTDRFLDGSLLVGSSMVLERVLMRDNFGRGIFTEDGLVIRDSTLVFESSRRGMRTSGPLLMEQSTLQMTSPSRSAIHFGETGDGDAVFRNSTIIGPGDVSGNSTDKGITGLGSATLHNTVIAGFSVACSVLWPVDILIVISAGWNVVDDRSCDLQGPGDLQGVDPRLAPLADNGGPTPTMALLDYSPALDGGDPSFTGPPFEDQRGAGFPRIVGSAIDVGAFEANDGVARPIRCPGLEVPIGPPWWIAGCVPQEVLECLHEFCGEVEWVVEFTPERQCLWCLVEIDLMEGWKGPARFSASLPLARADLLETAGLRLLDPNGEVIAEGEMRDGIEEGVPHLLVSGEVLEPGVYWLALDGAVEGEEGFVVREALRLNMDPL